MNYAEKLELVFQEYERGMDLDIALDLVTLSKEEREKMLQDEELRARILVCDASFRQRLIMDLKNIATVTQNDGVKLSAIDKLGKMFYPKRFREAEVGDSDRPMHISYVIAPKEKPA